MYARDIVVGCTLTSQTTALKQVGKASKEPKHGHASGVGNHTIGDTLGWVCLFEMLVVQERSEAAITVKGA